MAASPPEIRRGSPTAPLSSSLLIVPLPNSAGLQPIARLVDWTIIGVPPRIMGCGPVPAIEKLLSRVGKRAEEVDYYEINEAFAAVSLHAEKHLGVSREKTNLYGGGISIGHPPGATGARMTIVAMQHLAETGQRSAIVSMCLGAGHGMALMIENIER